MFSSPLAHKYARAFLNVTTDQVGDAMIIEIERLIAELQKHKGIIASLKILSCGESTAPDALVAFLGYFKIKPPLKNLVELLNNHKRLHLLSEVLPAIRNLYRKDVGIVLCEVTSACELENEEKKIIENFIFRRIAEHAQINYQINHGLIAGISIKTDDIIREDSVAQRMRAARISATRKYHGR